MSWKARLIAAAIPALTLVSSVQAIELDPKIVGFTLPKDIKWNENPSGNRTAVLQGDPASPGPTRCCSPGCRAK